MVGREGCGLRMSLQAGTIQELLVDREVSPHGYFLRAGERDVLLHYSEKLGEIKPGDRIRVFLYHDTEDRLTATMREPKLLYGELGLLEVADVHPVLGCFLDIGLSRHVLMPQSELPEYPDVRPQVGDQVYAVLLTDKQGRLLAYPAGERDLEAHVFRAPAAWKNQQVEAIVYNPLKNAAFAICQGGVLGFGAFGMIHESERVRPLRMGETVQARVAHVREDGRVNLSMRPLKQQGRDEDAERLLAYLRERPNGAMPYSDETPADVIVQRFQISKSAFKRALGKLMKEGLIMQKGNWTHLLEQSGQENIAGAGDSQPGNEG